MVEFKPNYARKDYLESNKYDCVVENKDGKKTGIIKVPRDVQMLYGVTHIFHIYVKDDKLLESIYESLKKPAEYPARHYRHRPTRGQPRCSSPQGFYTLHSSYTLLYNGQLMMNFSPSPTCVWNLPMSEPNSIRSLAFRSKATRSVR